MSDEEFAVWLRSVRREISPEESARREREKDVRRGEYIPRADITHHCGEAAH